MVLFGRAAAVSFQRKMCFVTTSFLGFYFLFSFIYLFILRWKGWFERDATPLISVTPVNERSHWYRPKHSSFYKEDFRNSSSNSIKADALLKTVEPVINYLQE